MELSDGERLFHWPLSLHVITAGWTYTDGSAHGAIDLRATAGTPVYAAEDGTVNWVQAWDGHTRTGNQSYGNLVRIRHGDYRGKQLESYYAHLSGVLVRSGQTVTEGQLIGYSGQTGNCYGAHLHFEVRLDRTRVHPLNWLDSDFSCAGDAVRAHLGSYTSVQRPATAQQEDKPTETKKLQKLCIVGEDAEIRAKAQALSLPVETVTAQLIGPASAGDAMTLWNMAQARKAPYFASTTEV